MARYTDIDALIEKVEETDWYHISEQGELVRGANSKYNTPLYKHSDIVGVLNNAPTADVVPKSEVAREIMKEVRQAILNMVLANAMGESYDIEKRFDEIEKKYTERCPDCKHFVGCECFDGKTCDEYEEEK